MIGHRGRFTRSEEDLERFQRGPSTAQTSSPSYRLAFADDELMVREELRAVRLQLELMKTELVQRDFGIEDTVVVFGRVSRLTGHGSGLFAGRSDHR